MHSPLFAFPFLLLETSISFLTLLGSITLWIPLSVFGYRELLHHQSWVLFSILRMQYSCCYCNSGTKTQRPWGQFQIFRSLWISWHQWTLKEKHIQKFPCLHCHLKPAIAVQGNPHLLSSKAETQKWII